MLPRVIMHNTVSLDGAIKDFEMDLGLHYELAGKIKADAHLVGSETAKAGVETFTEEVPEEEPSDFIKPVAKPNDTRPYWVIPDSKGKLKGLLHVYRRSCYCRGIIVIITNQTPDEYLQYLKDRNYDIILAGEDKVNFRSALEMLNSKYNVRTVLVDSGGILAGVLVRQGLVNEISLIISPVIAGNRSQNLFRTFENKVNLDLIKADRLKGNHVLVVYRVLRNITS